MPEKLTCDGFIHKPLDTGMDELDIVLGCRRTELFPSKIKPDVQSIQQFDYFVADGSRIPYMVESEQCEIANTVMFKVKFSGGQSWIFVAHAEKWLLTKPKLHIEVKRYLAPGERDYYEMSDYLPYSVQAIINLEKNLGKPLRQVQYA